MTVREEMSRALSVAQRQSKQLGTFPVVVGSAGTQRDILKTDRKETHVRRASRKGCPGKQKDQLLVNSKKGRVL